MVSDIFHVIASCPSTRLRSLGHIMAESMFPLPKLKRKRSRCVKKNIAMSLMDQVSSDSNTANDKCGLEA